MNTLYSKILEFKITIYIYEKIDVFKYQDNI